MRRAVLLLLCLSIGLPAAVAQEPMLVSVLYVTVKPGMEGAFAQMAADHLQWHMDTGDTHYYSTSQAATGENTGQYVFSSGPMTAAQLNEDDAFMETDMADVVSRGGMEQIASLERVVLETVPGLGNPPEPGHLAGLVNVWEIEVDLGQMPQFMDSLQKLDEIQRQVGSDNHVAFARMVSGGNLSTIFMIQWTSGWATTDMEREQRVAEAAGGAEAYGAIMEALTGTVDRVTVTSYRPLPELSFMPPAQ